MQSDRLSVTYIMTSVMMILADDGPHQHEGDLQFSIPRINARPGKGEYTRHLQACSVEQPNEPM